MPQAIYWLSMKEKDLTKSLARNWTGDTVPPGPVEFERTASFFKTGGLIAAHANGEVEIQYGVL